ncbi:MAG TPA: lanthionine synthetase LanC family protein [Thermoanaerobaculia bacterium]|nr:lanthionine synthetase LanC family protein [Thermoanaerobaculia bacterium]
MNVTERFLLGSDVLLIPCGELTDDVRERMSFDEGDFTLARGHGRALAQVIDGETAALLALFREPRTIADAVVENSRSLGKDPQSSLDELLPHLGTLLDDQVLVPAGAGDSRGIRPRCEGGVDFHGWKIVRCASLAAHCEVHQLRRGSEVAALKIARSSDAVFRARFEREAAILRHLDGSGIAPRLIDAGTDDRRPYLIVEWLAGADASVAAAQCRHDRVSLIGICASVAAAYAALHARGVLHGNVRPNRVVLAGAIAKLIGFEGGALDASTADEQPAVAAMLALLIAPMPEVEQILMHRHGSMPELAARLAEVRDAVERELVETPVSVQAAELLERTLQSFGRGGAMFATGYPEAPTASITTGCAGAAVGLLCIAGTRGDAALLELADVWRARAAARIGHDDAYYNPDWELPHELLGDVTPYHTEAGIHAAAAMIAEAMGKRREQALAVEAFLGASRRPCAELDLTLGRSGSLLAAALLLPGLDAGAPVAAALHSFGAETMKEIWEQLDERPRIDTSTDSLGMAHGWTGYLYVALQWCGASGDVLPARLLERLDELAALKTMKGRGAYWPCSADRPGSIMPGWCNGSAGQVFLFTLAHRLLGDERWLRLAELAAWNNWDEPRRATTLCCGTAGRAYALLRLYESTGAPHWLGRARQLANHAAAHAATTALRTNALWKGELGVAVLIADLASPAKACMPFFELWIDGPWREKDAFLDSLLC